ncbi:MAG: hypothetical protein BHV77_17625 [Bacteroides sp. 43_108]|nr:MAG: hypothetical protein BHV77_17625 [Bacteroides sp. 43_108]
MSIDGTNTHDPTAAPAVQQCGKRIITDKKMGADTKKCSNRTMLSFFIAIFIPDIWKILCIPDTG